MITRAYPEDLNVAYHKNLLEKTRQLRANIRIGMMILTPTAASVIMAGVWYGNFAFVLVGGVLGFIGVRVLYNAFMHSFDLIETAERNTVNATLRAKNIVYLTNDMPEFLNAWKIPMEPLYEWFRNNGMDVTIAEEVAIAEEFDPLFQTHRVAIAFSSDSDYLLFKMTWLNMAA